MKTRFFLGVAGALLAAAPAAATPPAWNGVCHTVGRFAGIVATDRDQRIGIEQAVRQARGRMGDAAVLPADVADEIAREIYGHPAVAPKQAAGDMGRRCLAIQAARIAPVPDPPPHPAITGLAPIALQTGENHVADFTPGGGPANVRLAWHDDGNGHGHDVFSAAVPGGNPIGMPGGDSVSDDPANDTNMTRSVRFARGRIDSRPATLLLIVQRKPGAGPTLTIYRVFHLVAEPGGLRFALLSQRRLPGGFCNADMALSAASGLPLRVSYRGAITPDGCLARGGG